MYWRESIGVQTPNYRYNTPQKNTIIIKIQFFLIFQVNLEF